MPDQYKAPQDDWRFSHGKPDAMSVEELVNHYTIVEPPPKPVYLNGVNLDVSKVGDKFVHIGKLTELPAIIDRFGPTYAYLRDAVAPSGVGHKVHAYLSELDSARKADPAVYDDDGTLVAYGSGITDRHKYEDAPTHGLDVLTPLGAGAFLVVGASAGKDNRGNNIPIIVYQDKKVGSSEEAPSYAGPASRGGAGYRYPTETERDYFTSGLDLFGQDRQYVVPKQELTDYPFDFGANAGLEASRNYSALKSKPAQQPAAPQRVRDMSEYAIPNYALPKGPVHLDEPTIREQEYVSPFRTQMTVGDLLKFYGAQ